MSYRNDDLWDTGETEAGWPVPAGTYRTPAPPAPRRRHTLRTVLLAAAGVVVALAVLLYFVWPFLLGFFVLLTAWKVITR